MSTITTTLSKAQTSKFFIDSDGYAQLVRRWANLVNDKESCKSLTSSHHLLYLVLRGKSLSKAFSPITKESKLANGFTPHDGYLGARSGLLRYNWQTRSRHVSDAVLAPFADLLDTDAVKAFLAVHLEDSAPGYKYLPTEEACA
ncbi:MAG: hypothetical protein JSS66_07645 [Armatimonadetes bacterium]|nr:hypothetical protein [Armatimonadota bacterium]